MTKYSTGSGGGGGDGDACELCGAETSNLKHANVAGAQLLVCSSCRDHDDNAKTSSRSGSQDAYGGGSGGGSGSPGGSSGGGSDGPTTRKQELAQKQAKVYDAASGDSSHWEEEGTDYEEDRLPYLVSGYGETVTEARQGAGLTVEELAEELGIDEDDLLAVEDGRAATAGVGGSVVRALEERFDVKIVDE
ncbi:multiprotein-bridging factor 1 family protein [Halorubrum gandharaense]